MNETIYVYGDILCIFPTWCHNHFNTESFTKIHPMVHIMLTSRHTLRQWKLHNIDILMFLPNFLVFTYYFSLGALLVPQQPPLQNCFHARWSLLTSMLFSIPLPLRCRLPAFYLQEQKNRLWKNIGRMS